MLLVFNKIQLLCFKIKMLLGVNYLMNNNNRNKVDYSKMQLLSLVLYSQLNLQINSQKQEVYLEEINLYLNKVVYSEEAVVVLELDFLESD
mmetsp:Transcript_11657/g.1799  ORF Transcript_11657/g.1799 Transcript_11657/m.1799 type:complete len:91 (+) Transcript_11657:135-407(+)